MRVSATRIWAREYLKLSSKGSSPLVVSPTHGESAKVTEAIREAKQQAGHIRNERQVLQYHNLQWELADRKRPENYQPGPDGFNSTRTTREYCAVKSSKSRGVNEKGVVQAVGKGREISLPLKTCQPLPGL